MKIKIYPIGPKNDGYQMNGKRIKHEQMIFASDN